MFSALMLNLSPAFAGSDTIDTVISSLGSTLYDEVMVQYGYVQITKPIFPSNGTFIYLKPTQQIHVPPIKGYYVEIIQVSGMRDGKVDSDNFLFDGSCNNMVGIASESKQSLIYVDQLDKWHGKCKVTQNGYPG
jgi:hypothetical protein